MNLAAIEIVEDRTAGSCCDEGFLTLRRLLVRNRYEDGSHSEPYPCDIVRRPGSDAVVAVLYERDPEGGVHVLLREAPRVPVYLRKHESFVHPDPREYLCVAEVVAGIVEEGDSSGLPGLRQRAVEEAREEAGLEVDEGSLAPLGGETFASPGTSDEKLYFLAAPGALDTAGGAAGDGSVMEECSRLVRLELGEAIRAARSGAIPDMKTEIALLRLADHLGWIPQLDLFASDLPPDLAARYRRLGVDAPEEVQ